ncbi:MAG TPA: outer membrane beta-barrel domain-containing protein [Steroidobacteraceae bacterium]|nr:outer membrane beta-barrel domain-containing protein [Steroidobacteraceae bacterium]
MLAASTALPGCASLRWPWQHEPPPVSESAPADTDNAPPPRVIEPEVERREIKVAKIDQENIEVGAFYGVMSVDDFGSNPVYGASITYHVTEDFFFRAEGGQTKLGLTSFEILNPGSDPLNLGTDRRLTYYGLSIGYNFLPGEVFLGRNQAMNSTFYVLGGVGSTKFADDERFTLNFGGGYKVLPTDWLAVSIEVQDRVYESDIFGKNELVNNLEAYLNLTVFF